MNQLFEYGSAVDILLIAKNPITIAGKDYKRGEIYTTLKDVGVKFNYTPTAASMDAKKPVYKGTIQNLPQSVSTTYVPLTDTLANLILTPVDMPQLVNEAEKRTSDSEGKIILRAKPSENLFVYRNNELIDSYQFDEATNTVYGLDAAIEYVIRYQTAVKSACYSLEQCFQPYFAAELIGKGNTNKSTNTMHILLPSVKIDVNPNFVFVDNGQLGVTLTLNIIYQGQGMPAVVFK